MSFLSDWSAYYPDLLRGLGVSVRLAGLALFLGLPAGLGLALCAGASSRLIRTSAMVFVEVGRGTPALVVLQLVYFGIPSTGWSVSAFLSASVALGLTTAAYTSEIIRGGLQAVPVGQVEAAQALGLRGADLLRYVIIPQGIRVALPALMGFAVLIFQATSLAYTIAIPEILSQAYSIGSSTFRYLSVLSLAGLMYVAVTVPASWLSGRVERGLARHL